jgi:hypothetical protein
VKDGIVYVAPSKLLVVLVVVSFFLFSINKYIKTTYVLLFLHVSQISHPLLQPIRVTFEKELQTFQSFRVPLVVGALGLVPFCRQINKLFL